MANISLNSVETKIMGLLSDSEKPLDLDTLVERMKESDRDARSVDVKIAAFSMVSSGTIALNQLWQLSAK